MKHREFNVKINGSLSESHEASSGIPQGSVLGPLLFIIFINDLPRACTDNYLYLFADDAKLFKIIRSILDAEILNNDCKYMFEWCKNWSMNVNVSKCKVLSLHPNRSSENYDYSFQGNNSDEFLTHVEEYSDLGVLIDSKLSFKDHIHNMVNKANRNLGLIRRNFNNIDIDSFKVLYFTLVRSNLEYCHSVWNPHTVELTEELENVQRRATKCIKNCKGLTYEERLKYLNLPTLKYRRLRGDMIQVFKILNDYYPNCDIPQLTLRKDSHTRGHQLKLLVKRPKYDIRKYSFTIRVVNSWNALPAAAVTATSINSFKAEFDNHYKNKDIYYNWRASY